MMALMKKLQNTTKFVIWFSTLASIIITTYASAQPNSSISAFITCIEEDGSMGLCTAEGWTMAEGYSASNATTPAELTTREFTGGGGQDICEIVSVPEAIEVNLSNSDFAIGDRIFFSELMIEALDDNGNFMPRVPIYVQVLAQDGMFMANSDWDYIEVATYGQANIFVNFYCEQHARVSDSVIFTVAPE